MGLTTMTVVRVLLGSLSLGIAGYLLSGVTFSQPSYSQTAQYQTVQFAPEEQATISVYQSASPAVVTIAASSNRSGSGSIVSPDGLVLTNEHVVRRSRTGRVAVITADGTQYTGQVIATDRRNDLALIRLNATGPFPFIPLAPESGISVGQQVYAIGSPFGLSGTLTTGILSRIADNGDLQTDAAINPGNSGGPLLNSQGQLIGVNKAILSSGGRGNIGIGFATNAQVAQTFISGNLNNASVAAAPSGRRLGVTLDTQTLVIQTVEPGSSASTYGLRPGDQLVGFNGQRLMSIEQLLNYLDQNPATIDLIVGRNQRLSGIRVQF